MKNHLTTVLLVSSLVLASCASVNTAHTPPDGSAEKNAILQAVQHALARQGRKNLVLDVPYLKVHNGWAWIQVNPQISRRESTLRVAIRTSATNGEQMDATGVDAR